MAHIRLTLLGGFQARLASGSALSVPTKKAQALLAYLALRPGQPHPRDKLAALLWGDSPEAQARDSLRHTLGSLRKALPVTTPPALSTEGQSLVLNPDAVDVDVAAFEQLVAENTPEAFERAAALYQGDLLEGLSPNEAAFEEWLLAERERLRELALEALAKLLAHQSTAGVTEQAIRTAMRVLALDPLQEVAHRALMRLYVRQGRRQAALRQYQVCVGTLQRELGAEPEPETRQLYQDILRRLPPESAKTGVARDRPAPEPRAAAFRSPPDIPPHEAPLIGRESELARLRQALEAASKGRGQFLVVVGEAGIGKSRLLGEVATKAFQQGSRVLVGRCYESEGILPFGPWVDALRSGGVATDAEFLEGLGPVWRGELGRLLPELAPPGPQPSRPTEDYRRLFEAVAQLVRQLASKEPLVLILEDLHWADEISLRLLAFLGRRLQIWPVLLVGTVQEEELASAPVLRHLLQDLEREQRLLCLALPRLLREETTALVRALARVGRDDAAVERVAGQVWAASHGNPFLVVETMGALQEGTTPEALRNLPVPQRVQDVILRRLERLSPRSEPLLAVAAVIGREFDFALLERASGLGGRETAEGLEELVRRRVLHGVGERFHFAHDRIREVAYSQLLPPRRKLLHGEVAKALEALYAKNLEPHYAALALHYREGEVWDKALTLLRRAGLQADARSAHREAAACFEQALIAIAHLPETRETIEQAIDLRFDLRNSLVPLTEFDRMLGHLRAADTLARTLGDPGRLGRLSVYWASYFWLMGDYDWAIESCHRALALAAEIGDSTSEIGSNAYLGSIHHTRGDYWRAIDVLRTNLTSLKGDYLRGRFGLAVLPCVWAQSWLAWCLAEVGAFSEAILIGGEGVRNAEAVDHAYTIILAYFGVGMAYLGNGDLQRAVPALERSLVLCQVREVPTIFPWIAAALGYAYALLGRTGEALPLLGQAVEQAVSMGFVVHQSLRVAWLSEASLLAGRTGDAIRFGLRALDLARDREERGHEAWALRILGEIAAHGDPPEVEKAESYYRQAVALAKELGMHPLLARCRLGLGILSHKAGRPDQARSELASAVELFRSMGMAFWLTRAEANLTTAGG